MTLVTLINSGQEPLVQESPFVRLAPQAKILGSEVEGFHVLGDGACFNRCRIGKYSGMGCFSYIADTDLGRYCTIASRVSIGSFEHPLTWLSIHEFQYRDVTAIYGDSLLKNGENLLRTDDRPTRIGSDVWIGDNACLKRGISIGHGAVVGMGAVVTRDVEPFSIVVGNPARHLRFRFGEDERQELIEIAWWNWDIAAMEGIDFQDISKALKVLRTRKTELNT